MTPLLLIAIFVLMLGATLVAVALRGKRIDNHPICHQCGFDLYGLDAITRCPECGVELIAEKIELGHRAIRRRPLVLGLILGAPALALVVVVMIAMARHVDTMRYKPVWLLLHEKDTPALRELNRRLLAGALSDSNLDRIIQAALKMQGDVQKTWLADWGDFVETARFAGKVPDPTWQLYTKQGIPLTLIVRSVVRRGDPIPLRVDYGPCRLGSRGAFRALMRTTGITLAGHPLGAGTATNMRIKSADRGSDLFQVIPIPRKELASLRDGPRAVNADVVLELVESISPLPRWNFRPGTTVPISEIVTLVPENQQTVEVVTDPSLQRAVQSSLNLFGYSRGWGQSGSGRHVLISKEGPQFLIAASRPPIGLAFDVIVRDRAGREWPMHSVSFPRDSDSRWIPSGSWNGFNADRVDVILRPSRAAAAETVDITRIWGGELAFRDVPVVWEKDAKRPTSQSADIPRWSALQPPQAATGPSPATMNATTKSTATPSPATVPAVSTTTQASTATTLTTNLSTRPAP